MKKIILRTTLVVSLCVLMGSIFLYSGDTDRKEMIAKYGEDKALFVDDGKGGTLHYRDEGNRDGEVLLLIHGSNSHLQTWEAMVDILKDKYRLISYDQPGHGLSGPSGYGDYRGDAMAAAGAKILDAAGVEKAIWIGNSMGGWVSWRAALSQSDRVAGLILIDASGAQGGEKTKPYLGARLMQTAIGQAILPYITPRFMVKSSLEQSVFDKDDLNEDVITRYWELLRFSGNRQATIKRSNSDRETEKWKEVGGITVPTLILWGQEDYVIPVSHAKLFANAINGSKLIVYPEMGHLPMEEDAKLVAEDIHNFISVQEN